MADMMTFPNTVEEFMEQYKIVDDEKVYTNGADLVPIFRMKQWFEHISATDKNVGTTDTISRQQAIDAICSICGNDCDKSEFIYNAPQDEQVIMCPEHYALSTLPPTHTDNQVHLCDSCSYTYPECPSVYSDMIFGNGIGNDNVCACSKYLPPAQPEPCEDAVSKETILKFLDDWVSALDESCHNQSVSDLKIIKRDFENLPLVTHKQRTGKWERHYSRPNVYADLCWHCSACGYYHADNWTNKFKYCPNCGAKMTEGEKK